MPCINLIRLVFKDKISSNILSLINLSLLALNALCVGTSNDPIVFDIRVKSAIMLKA